MSAKEKKNKSFQSTRKERVAFGIYGVGLNIFFVVIGGFLQQYYLINVAVPAITVGAVFLVVKIWDGINDPLFGIIVDRANLKSGKFLPWLRIATFAVPLMATMLFLVPLDASVTFKAIFLLLGYMLFDAASTMAEVPYFALPTAMTTNPKERSSIISVSKIISVVPAALVLFFPDMYGAIGWHKTVIIFSGFALLTMLPGFFLFRERHMTRPETPPKVRTLLRYIGTNRYLLIYFLSAVLYGVTNTAGAVGNLFAIYNLGGDHMIVPILLVSTVPSLLAIPLVNGLLGKFEKYNMLLASLLMTGVLSVVMYFCGYQNLTLFYILSALRGFSTGAHTMIFFLYTPDFSEYGTYITGTKAEGAAFSIQSLASKLIGAIASASSLFILGAFGFVEGAGTQTPAVQDGIWLLYSIFIVIGIVLQAFILIFFFKLRDKDVAVMIDANHGEITYEEADELLGGRYPRKPEPTSE